MDGRQDPRVGPRTSPTRCGASPRRWSASARACRPRPTSARPTPSCGIRTAAASCRFPRSTGSRWTLLRGIDRVRDVLMDNTERFAKGLPANNALLWGARGMGKSSLVKACARGDQRGERRQARRGHAQADRDPPRGHREPARPDDAAARHAAARHHLLRRPVVRSRTTRPTSRSRRCSKAASRAVPTT